MKKATLLVCSLVFGGSLFAQYNTDFGIKLGGANYLGEMGGKEKVRQDFVLDLKMSQTNWHGGVYYRHRLGYNSFLNHSFNYARIAGDDALSTNPGRVGRNLSFRNDIFELSSRYEFRFYNVNDVGHYGRYIMAFSSYVYGGIGLFYHNPKAELDGEWHSLRPLRTEGQIQQYSLVSASIPIGAGFNFTYDKKYRFGAEIGWRTTFTDYLDDVSTTYATAEALGEDALAIALANRHNELDSDIDAPAENNYAPGEKRGDQSHNDSYLMASLNAGYVIRGKSSYHNFLKDRYRKMQRDRRTPKFRDYRYGGGGRPKWNRHYRNFKVRYKKPSRRGQRRKKLVGGR